MTNFEKAMHFVLKWEGTKFVNHPNDPGGATKYGVTLSAAQKKMLDKDGDGDVDAEDVKELTLEDAFLVYRDHYWNAYNCDKYDLPMCVAVMDSYVQHRPKAVRAMLDVSATDWRVFLKERKDFYTRIIIANPKLKVFQKGWINRMNDLTKYCEILELE